MLLISVVLGGCASETPAVESVADSIQVSRRRCVLPPGTAIAGAVAARCAELFVARNGYTDLPPVPDSTEWSPEFMDTGMAGRRSTLQRDAAGVCAFARGSAGVTVLFPYAPGVPLPMPEGATNPPAPRARMVQVDPDGTMEMMHAEVELSDTTVIRLCRPSGDVAAEAVR